jgi:hypothetical protein
MRRLLLLGVVFVVAACGMASGTRPAATPADFEGITAQLALRGISVNRFVSGNAGCDDPTLRPTAIAFDAGGLDQAATVRLHVYIFRNRETFERLRSSVDSCAAAFVTDPESFESVDASPYVVAGQGPWGPRFKAALRDGLTVAAGTGG